MMHIYVLLFQFLLINEMGGIQMEYNIFIYHCVSLCCNTLITDLVLINSQSQISDTFNDNTDLIYKTKLAILENDPVWRWSIKLSFSVVLYVTSKYCNSYCRLRIIVMMYCYWLQFMCTVSLSSIFRIKSTLYTANNIVV